MSLFITSKCISCDMCLPACPNEAIYINDDLYHIDASKCSECVGFYDKPQCEDVCPIDCITRPKELIEPLESLQAKHQETLKKYKKIG